jgi:hypothetical protein
MAGPEYGPGRAISNRKDQPMSSVGILTIRLDCQDKSIYYCHSGGYPDSMGLELVNWLGRALGLDDNEPGSSDRDDAYDVGLTKLKDQVRNLTVHYDEDVNWQESMVTILDSGEGTSGEDVGESEFFYVVDLDAQDFTYHAVSPAGEGYELTWPLDDLPVAEVFEYLGRTRGINQNVTSDLEQALDKLHKVMRQVEDSRPDRWETEYLPFDLRRAVLEVERLLIRGDELPVEWRKHRTAPEPAEAAQPATT